ETSVVIIDRKQVIHEGLALGLVPHSICQIKPLDGKINQNVQLVAEAPAVREALEVNHQDIWTFPEFKLFAGPPMLLAPGTVPGILIRQDFLFGKLVQAVLQVNSLAFAFLPQVPLPLQLRVYFSAQPSNIKI